MKKWICLSLALLVLLCTALPTLAEQPIKVVLKGETLDFADAEPMMVNDRTMVPMRFIFEKLGAAIYWDEATETVFAFTATDTLYWDEATETVFTITTADTILMQIGSDRMFINDEQIDLDVPPQLIDDRTMVPLRAVSEAFGLKVEWNDATSTVIITE